MKRILLSFIIGLFVLGGVHAFADEAVTTETTTTETTSETTTPTSIWDQINIASTLKNLAVNTEPAVFYSLNKHEATYLTQYVLAEKETSFGTFSGNMAYGSSDTLLGTLSYKTETLEKIGVKVFVLKDIFASLGCGAGYTNVSDSDREFTHGVIAGLGAIIPIGN